MISITKVYLKIFFILMTLSFPIFCSGCGVMEEKKCTTISYGDNAVVFSSLSPLYLNELGQKDGADHWLPTREEVCKAKDAMFACLMDKKNKNQDDKLIIHILNSIDNYKQQYFGLYADGDKVIRCLFFPVLSSEIEETWRTQPVFLKDGNHLRGDYDLATGVCENFIIAESP